MDIGKLPTDNLYKFIAIGGLILILIGIGFTYTYMYNVEKLQIEQLNRIHNESIDFGPLTAKEASLERKMNFLDKIARNKFDIKSITFPDSTLSPKLFDDFKTLKYEYESLIVEKEAVKKEIDANKENLDFKMKGIQLEQGRILKDSIKYYVLSFFGFILFVAGLLLWYYKTQRVIDKKLRNEANYEKLFDLRYIALKEINLIFYKIQPKRIWEDMDEYEAYENVAFNQSLINQLISSYLNNHSAILDSVDLTALKKLERISNDIQFEINQTQFSVSKTGIDLSKELISNLKLICDNMKTKFDKEYK
jgi:hypothetical protein